MAVVTPERPGQGARFPDNELKYSLSPIERRIVGRRISPLMTKGEI